MPTPNFMAECAIPEPAAEVLESANGMCLMAVLDNDPNRKPILETLKVDFGFRPICVLLPYTHAHFSLSRLGGCNYKMPVTRKGRWVTVENPQCADVHYRMLAEQFDSGKRFFRDGWCIRRWDAEAERITEAEKGWQT